MSHQPVCPLSSMKFSYLVIWYHPSSCLVQTVNLSHPFHIHLSTYSLKPSTSESTDIPSSTPTTTSQVQQGAGEASTSTATTSPILQSSENDPPLEIHTDAPELVNDGHHWYEDIENDTLTPNEQHPATSFRDPAAHTKAHQLLKKATTEANSQDVLCSRVLGDIWHLMNQFPIAQAHGLRRPFARALRAAFFKYDPEDLATLRAFFESKGVSFDYVLRSHPAWLLQCL